MKQTVLIVILSATLWLAACKAEPGATTEGNWPTCQSMRPYEGRQVTVIIAMSSVVPGGIVGHAGIAVDEDYWDFGPKRSKYLQPIKSIRSTAGPWWDDPDQDWATDRTLQEVLDDMADKVHPVGSLIAVFTVRVTDDQAKAITDFWQTTYDRMAYGEDTYRLTARQCASMVGWGLQVGLNQSEQDASRLPRELHLMTPTKLYESLSEHLVHTAGPDAGQPADLTFWQLKRDGITKWKRPDSYAALSLPKLPRTRLAIERIKHLPAELTLK